MKKLWFDTETFSATPITEGTYKYAENCEVMLLTYAIDDSPVEIVDFTKGDAIPCEFIFAFECPDVEIWGHNTMFDRTVLRYALGLEAPIERWRDTMVQALAHGLPGSLGTLCDIFKISEDKAKIKDGSKLIHLFCKPLPTNRKLRRATHETHPEEWARFCEYAIADTAATREIHRLMPKWNYPNNCTELELWHCDQRINDRGFNVDLELVDGAIAMVAEEQQLLKQDIREKTNNDVQSATQRDEMLRHIFEQHGIYLKDLQKDTLKRALDDERMSEPVRELIRIRLSATSTSTSKYKALRKAVNADGRCRGTLQFCGAQRTGRDAGRTFQPQNLPSRGLLPPEETEFGIGLMRDGLTVRDYFIADPMLLAVSAVRGVLVPSDDKVLNVSDLANIEGRYAAWTAGEEWKLQAFQDYDAGIGPDLYVLAYARSFNVEPDDVSKDQRQIGKVQELMLQYQGGVGAFVTGAATYGFDIEELAENIYDTLPEAQVSEANSFLAFCVKKKMPRHGLSDRAFVTCDVLKRLWREAHPQICSLWKDLEEAARCAIAAPNTEFRVRDLVVDRKGMWLRIKLQSGRYLCYPSPRIDTNGKISYMGVNQYTKKWDRISTYGGKLFENICQAGSRDVLFHAIPSVEAEGYQVLIRVHDELVCESEKDLTVERLSEIMTAPRDWTVGLPLAAAGETLLRYRK